MAYLAFRPEEAPALPEIKKATQSVPEEKQREKELKPSLPGGLGDTGEKAEGEPALPSGMGGGTEKTQSGGPALPTGLTGNPSKKIAEGPSLPGGLEGKPEKPVKEAAPESKPVQEEKPQLFKDPKTLRWIGALQAYLDEEVRELVGKSNSVTDIVKTVHRELMVGVKRDGHVISREEAMRVPDTRGGVAQSLLQFQNSHRPQDLWHFVTPDYRTAVVWLQLTSGDNRDMNAVARKVDDWLKFWDLDEAEAVSRVEKDPERFRPVMRSLAKYVDTSGGQLEEIQPLISRSPAKAASMLKKKTADLSPIDKLRPDWFGLTYINVIWQEKMVMGLLNALLGSFLAVFLMMTLLYRSAMWGALCMAPLTVTIAMIYGLVGLIGKDYDMPVAVLSALSLGLAVDYAIHFLTRSRMMYLEYGSWQKTAGPVFGEPARAISRNAIVVGIGFLPLLLAPLVPYQTVGIFIAAILLLAGIATMLLLPAVVALLENKLFPRARRTCTTCHRITCVIATVSAVVLVVFNVHQFIEAGWTLLTWISVPIVVLLGGWCTWMSRGEKAVTEAFARDEGRASRK
jgi:hypothetical protein